MGPKGEKLKPFDLVCLVSFLLLLILALYFFFSSKILLALLILALSFWALAAFLGSTILAPVYLEGHIVRLLIKNGGSIPLPEIQSYYSEYGTLDFVINRLKERSVIEEKYGNIKLLEDNIAKGFKNKLMLWGTRRVKL